MGGERFNFVDFIRHIVGWPAGPALVNLGNDAGRGIELVCLMAALIFGVYEDLWAGVKELVLDKRNQTGSVVIFLEKRDFPIIEASSVCQRQAVEGTDD